MIHNLCSHLQNASKMRMKYIQVPYSKTSEQILSVLYNHGMISNLQLLDNERISQRKLKVDLKYRHGNQVLNSMKLISKPSRRVFATCDEIMKILAVKNVGDLLIIKTSKGIMEARDALKEEMGGEVLILSK